MSYEVKKQLIELEIQLMVEGKSCDYILEQTITFEIC